METYQRLRFNEREELSRCLASNLTYRQMGRVLGRSPSTISREIRRRGLTRLTYRAVYAQHHTQRIARMPRRPRKLDACLELQKIVIQHLRLRWSPEQIARRLRILYPDDMSMRVSHETIYAYVYVHPRRHLKRRLLFYLRRQHKYRRVKNKQRQKCRPIQDFISIEDRPPEVTGRKIAGHWEGDLVMGALNRSAIGTLVERTTRMTFIVKLKGRDAACVRESFARKLNRLPDALKRSLTYDQGHEMAEHKIFTEKTRIQVYFAHPHSPWERGTSENTNGLIRDLLPQGTDFSKITAKRLKRIEDMLNDRPRKVLNFYTPKEVFTKVVALEA